MIINSLQEFCTYFTQERPLLGIDFGEKKVGFALSDPQKLLAMPLMLSTSSSDKQKIADIISLSKKHNVCGIVIGLPLNMDGTDSSRTTRVKSFVNMLSCESNLPIFLQDERMTSSAANSLLKESGMSRKDRAKIDDQVAASMILESTLIKLRNI